MTRKSKSKSKTTTTTITMTMKKGQLFSDDNPDTTVHGYGFANEVIANHTLENLKNRDIDYQFQVVNTMYHRGLQVMKRMKDENKRISITKATNKYKVWLDDYKDRQRGKLETLTYLSPKEMDSLEFLAEYYKISDKARGLAKPTKSDVGFKVMWKSMAKGDKKKLRNMPIMVSKPDGNTWDKHRNNYIKRRISMLGNTKNGLYYSNGLPSKLHINMIMWAYSPDKRAVLGSIGKYKDIINSLKK